MARLYQVDHEARRERRQTPRVAKKRHAHIGENGERREIVREVSRTPEQAEAAEFVATLARNFAASIEFYKTEPGGNLSHEDAVE